MLAELLVPPDLGLDQLSVEVTADPLPAVSSLLRVREAIKLGRRAASLQALGQRTARARWFECADAWTALGDHRRAELAQQYASSKSARRPLIAERVAAAISAA